MSDFRSLLSSFQDATGTTTSRKQASSSSTTKSQSSISTTIENETQAACQKDIEKLWRTTQIQNSFQRNNNNNNSTNHDTSGNSDIDKKPLHIAICATIVDQFPHEEIWKKWLLEQDDDNNTATTNGPINTNNNTNHNNSNITASIHIHAKNPNKIRNHKSWLKSKVIPISHNPNWNDYRIIKAMLSLVEYAIRYEPQTTHFMMVTESCIPVCTLVELGNVIRQEQQDFSGSRSFLDMYGVDSTRCTRFDEHACFSINAIPKDAIYKALPGWALFSRSHMDEVLHIRDRLNGKELYPLFKSVWAPEEVYFSTALVLLGKYNQIVKRSLMWSKWDERARNSKDRAHPIVYDGQFTKSLIDDVKAQGCLFMRKWKRELDVQQWERMIVIQNNTSSGSGNDRKDNKRKENGDTSCMDDEKVLMKRQKLETESSITM